MLRDTTPKEEGIPIAPSLALEDDDSSNKPMVSTRLIFISIQVVINAILIGFMAKIMVALINLITNLSFYGKVSFAESSPAGNHLGLWVIIVPVIGGVLVVSWPNWDRRRSGVMVFPKRWNRCSRIKVKSNP